MNRNRKDRSLLRVWIPASGSRQTDVATVKYSAPMTCLRFFTVYGPWGRPDMAYYKFVRAIEEGRPLDLYNHGRMQRDVTCVDKVVGSIRRVLLAPPARRLCEDKPRESAGNPKFRTYNIGNRELVSLSRFVEIIEEALSKKAIRNLPPRQPGGAPSAHAMRRRFFRDMGFAPDTPLETGIHKFVGWHREYHSATVRGKGRAA